MFRRKRTRKVIKLVLLLVCLFLIIRVIRLTLARYQSEGDATANVEIARFIVNRDFQSMTLKLDTIVPSDTSYVYNFSVANYEDEILTDTVITYDLTIRTTTNLPLTYELYYIDDEGQTEDAIKENTIIQDDDLTYFRKITTESITFGFEEEEERQYQLVINFPSYYSSIDYQDIIEGIEITVSAEQVTTSSE